MRRRRRRRTSNTDDQDRFDDSVAELLARVIVIVVVLLLVLFFLNKALFWSLFDRWVLPGVAVLFAVGVLAVMYRRARNKREHVRLQTLFAQIARPELAQEVRNFIDGFGNDKNAADPWVSASGAFTFNRSQIRRLRDLLAGQGVALSLDTDDDIIAVLEHYIEEQEDRFLKEHVTARVAHRFSELNKTGDDFERLIVRLYEAMGYAAKRIGRSGDQGGDVVASKGGEHVLIQAKFYGGSVGNAAVQQAVAAKEFYHCTRAVVAASSSFTSEAIALADANAVELIDGAALKQLLAEHLHEAWA
jgi:hypothetical protein